MREKFDLIVIGGGSGGIAGARRAADYGARVALIEGRKLGGTCVNVGCIPKKIMWNASRLSETLNDAIDYGFTIDRAGFCWNTLKRGRDTYVNHLNKIYRDNLETSGVKVFHSWASFADTKSLTVETGFLDGDHILVASGSLPSIPSIPGSNLGITSDEFFALEKQPGKVLIVGSGYIASEFAGVLNVLGSDVTLLIRNYAILREFDVTLRKTVMEEMQKNGIRIITNTNVKELTRDHNDQLRADCDGAKSFGPFDTVIWAIGRKSTTYHLNLEAAGIRTDSQDYIITDDYQNTNTPQVYAVGDVTGKKALTPVAIAASRKLADRIFGGQIDAYLDYNDIPTVIFSHPPVGTVGLTEDEAVRSYGYDQIRVYEHRFTNLYYGLTQRKPPTTVKLIVLGDNERIVGCHAVGEAADELIQGFAVAVKMGARKIDFDNTVAIHPTAAEELVTLRGSRKPKKRKLEHI